MLTGILCTARQQPEFDWMADSVVQALAQAPVDFELIVVDKLMWISDTANDDEPLIDRLVDLCKRQNDLAGAINGRFSYRHVPPKPTVWQGPWRKTKRDYFDLNNARNTGLALARGSHVVFFDDCSVVDPRWLVHHQVAATKGVALAGAFSPRKNVTGFTGAGLPVGDPYPEASEDHRRVAGVKAVSGGWLWGLNMSFPLEYALRANGFDELYSGQGGSDDCDFGVRIERLGCRIFYDAQCIVYPITTNHSELFGWPTGKALAPKERVLADGRLHYANEFLIQELLEDGTQTQPRGNDFDLRTLRTKALSTGDFPPERTLTHDWRDMQALEEM